MNNEPNKPAQELTEKELEGIVGGKEGIRPPEDQGTVSSSTFTADLALESAK